MDELDDVAVKALDNYYNIISTIGYTDNNKILRLLYVVLMSKFMGSLFSQYIDDKDYKCIINSLNCMSDCMIDFIDYPTFKDNIEPIYNIDNYILRITESGIIRLTEDNNLRVLE